MLIKGVEKELKPQIAVRAVKAGKLFTGRGLSLAETAKELGVSVSTVYKDITEHLLQIDPALQKKVRKILDAKARKRYADSAARLEKNGVKKRALIAAIYFLNVEEATYGETAKAFGVSLRTITRDLNVRLAALDADLFRRVQETTKERLEDTNAER